MRLFVHSRKSSCHHMQWSSRGHVGELEAEDDLCVQVGACSVQRVRTWLPWSDWKIAAGISVPEKISQMKTSEDFWLCGRGHVQSIFNYLFLFHHIFLSECWDRCEERWATSVKFDCKTKTWRYDKSDSISTLKYIFLHTHSHSRRPGVRHPAFQGLSSLIASYHSIAAANQRHSLPVIFTGKFLF